MSKRKGCWITWAKVLWNCKANKLSNRGTKMLSRNILITIMIRWKKNKLLKGVNLGSGRHGEKKRREKNVFLLIIIPIVQFNFLIQWLCYFHQSNNNTLIQTLLTFMSTHMNPINSGMMNSDKSYGKNDECS